MFTPDDILFSFSHAFKVVTLSVSTFDAIVSTLLELFSFFSTSSYSSENISFSLLVLVFFLD